MFIFESRSGYQSIQFTDACLNFETLLSSYRLSFSDILYDEGAILNHDNTCPCNPLRRKKKTLDIIRYSTFFTNSSSAKSQLEQLLFFKFILVFSMSYSCLFFQIGFVTLVKKPRKIFFVDTLSVCVDGYVFCLKIYSWLPK